MILRGLLVLIIAFFTGFVVGSILGALGVPTLVTLIICAAIGYFVIAPLFTDWVLNG